MYVSAESANADIESVKIDIARSFSGSRELALVLTKRFRRVFPVLSDEMDAEIRRAYRGGLTYADPRFLDEAMLWMTRVN